MDYLRKLVLFNKAKTDAKARQLFDQLMQLAAPDAQILEPHQYEFYRKWYHTALYNLMDCYEFRGDFEALAIKLDPAITVLQARESIELLQKLKLVQPRGDGRYVQTHNLITSGEAWRSFAVHTFQENTLKLALHSLEHHHRQVRDFSTLTMSIASKDLEKVRELTKEYRKAILKLVQERNPAGSASETTNGTVAGIVVDSAGHGGVVRLSSNKTLLGVGYSVGFDSLGVIVRTDSNIVIRNLLFRRAFDDAVGIEESAKNIWVDHNSFEKCGDGQIDIKRASEWITVSWNHFSRHKSVSVVGHSDDNGAQDSTHLHVTFHHNWFDHVEGAAPRVRFGTVHSFNNVYDSLTSYGVASTEHALVVVENNVFRNTKTPTEIRHTSPLDGDLVARNNLLIASGVPAEFGTAFDPAKYYSANVDSVELVEPAVLYGAGAGKLR